MWTASATLLEREDLGNWERLRFAVPAGLARYIAEKGSIAVDGVSLTVTAVSAAGGGRALVRGGPDPHHPGGNRAGRQGGGRPGQPGSGRAGQVHRAAAGVRPARRTQGRTCGGGSTVSAGRRQGLLDPVRDAVEAIAAGKPVLVVDDEDRENEGDIIFAAQHSTPALMGWTIRHSSGVICVPLAGDRADALAAAADGAGQPGRQGHRLHGLLRRGRRREHRHQRHGPLPHRPGAGGSGFQPRPS